MKRAYADTPEGQVHYATEGTGDPLLLLPQAPRSHRMYTELMPFLAKRYRVIAMDILGYGNSDPPPLDVRIGDMARCVAHFLEALGIKRTHLFGLHTGACIAGEVAAAYPEKIATVVWFGYPMVEADSERQAIFQAQGASGLMGEPSADGAHVVRMWSRAYNYAVSLTLHTGSGQLAEHRTRALKPAHSYMSPEMLRFMNRYSLDSMQSKDALMRISRAVFTHDSASRLPLIKAPALHIQADSLYEHDFCKRGSRLEQLIRGAKAVTLPGTDDNAAEFKAPELAQLILDFVGKHPL